MTKQVWISVGATIVFFVIWKVVSVCVGSSVILPLPEKTLLSLMGLFTQKLFLLGVAVTLLRGLCGFALAVGLGAVMGLLCGWSAGFRAFMTPLLVAMRATPVIAFVLMCLIWFTPAEVPVVIAFLTMFPIVTINMSDGMRQTDPLLLEMAQCYRVSGWRLLRDVYLPSSAPFFFNGLSAAVGIGWRAIIIGEVLAQPLQGLGTRMHEAQQFLQMDRLLAWTLVAVILSYAFEHLVRWAERSVLTWRNKV